MLFENAPRIGRTNAPSTSLQAIAPQGKPCLTREPINPIQVKAACSTCNMRELCMPVNLSAGDLERLDELVATRRKQRFLPRLGDSLARLFSPLR